MRIPFLADGTYIVAVSGGVDSVVLLHMLKDMPGLKLIVAHIDHGIRPDSHEDEELVRQLSTEYSLQYAAARYELGPNASEESARKVRYEFLHELKDTYQARSIIAAHHANDIVETMIINIIRGTGWRGLSSLRETDIIKRPLLGITKQDIISYAQKENLRWREDSTNEDGRYLRNRVRTHIMPAIKISEWLELYQKQCALLDSIDQELADLATNKRYPFIMWPHEVAIEVVRHTLHVTRPQAEYALWKIKTARNATWCEAGSSKKLQFTRGTFVIK